MKKLLSTLLAFVMCVSLCVPAFAEGNETSFTDVKEGAWYYDAVKWAVDNDIVQGISETEFGVNNIATRAQMVTFLWRMVGSPEPLTVHGFTDVPEGKWYADAVNWAAERGIVNGVTDTTFDPNGELTREQAAAFLYREEQRRGGGFTGMWAFPLKYDDADKVASYAYEPLCWMTMEDVVKGSGGMLLPKDRCTRAQLVTMLYRYVEQIAAPEDPAYTEKEVPVLRESTESTETATLRYYEDMPNVPYVELSQYYNQFYLVSTDLTEGLTDSRLGSHHVVANIGGYTAEIDTRTDAIVTDDLSEFTLLAYYLQLEMSGEVDENYPFISEDGTKLEPEYPEPMTLRLGDYGIDIRGGEDGVYIPLNTLGDIYGTTSLRYTVFNGEKLYAEDYTKVLQKGSAIAADDSFSEPYLTARGEDLAEYTYNELCFNIDTFYGRPGQELIHDALEEGKLDDVLSESYPEVKELLLSTDIEKYYTGFNLLLHGLLFDGGHTGIISRFADDNEEVNNVAITELMQSECSQGFLTYVFGHLVLPTILEKFREEVYAGDYYVEKGDTAMIRFDAFEVDNEGWKAFYAGTGDMPFEGDTLGTVYAGIMRASKNPEIKNIVIDISCNGGGDSAAMNAIEWLMTGEGFVNFKSRLTGQVNAAYVKLDANFDGVFDENDKPITQFNYAVLTSPVSFSCGNAFPFFMKELGYPTLGEQSGGGACAIRASTMGGLEFCCSAATSCIVTEDGGSVDNGCPVDFSLYQEVENPDAEDTLTGYESFYDLDVISAAMNEFFGTAQQDQAA